MSWPVLPFVPTFHAHIIVKVCVYRQAELSIGCKLPGGNVLMIDDLFVYILGLIDCLSFMYSMVFFWSFFFKFNISFISYHQTFFLSLYGPTSDFLSSLLFFVLLHLCVWPGSEGLCKGHLPLGYKSLDNMRHHFPVRSDESELYYSQTVMFNIDRHNMHDCLS